MRASPALRWSGRACRACPRASPPDPPGCDHPWMRTLRQCAFAQTPPQARTSDTALQTAGLPSPIELELLVAPQQMVEPEVDGSHVERGDFRLELRRRPHTLLDLHVGTAASGQIDHGAAALLQARQEFPEALRRLIWSSGLG